MQTNASVMLDAFLQAEIYALQQKLGDPEEEEEMVVEEEVEEEEEEEEEEEKEDGDEGAEAGSEPKDVILASTRTRRTAIFDAKAERKRMSLVLEANGMNKAELSQVAPCPSALSPFYPLPLFVARSPVCVAGCDVQKGCASFIAA